jgi:hypothetical protein
MKYKVDKARTAADAIDDSAPLPAPAPIGGRRRRSARTCGTSPKTPRRTSAGTSPMSLSEPR